MEKVWYNICVGKTESWKENGSGADRQRGEKAEKLSLRQTGEYLKDEDRCQSLKYEE